MKMSPSSTALPSIWWRISSFSFYWDRCKSGNGFANVSYEETVSSIKENTEGVQRKMESLKADLDNDQERAAILKKVLQSKFGDAIQLESQ